MQPSPRHSWWSVLTEFSVIEVYVVEAARGEAVRQVSIWCYFMMRLVGVIGSYRTSRGNSRFNSPRTSTKLNGFPPYCRYVIPSAWLQWSWPLEYKARWAVVVRYVACSKGTRKAGMIFLTQVDKTSPKIEGFRNDNNSAKFLNIELHVNETQHPLVRPEATRTGEPRHCLRKPFYMKIHGHVDVLNQWVLPKVEESK